MRHSGTDNDNLGTDGLSSVSSGVCASNSNEQEEINEYGSENEER